MKTILNAVDVRRAERGQDHGRSLAHVNRKVDLRVTDPIFGHAQVLADVVRPLTLPRPSRHRQAWIQGEGQEAIASSLRF